MGYIILDDVSLTELSFGKEYSAAVESKQIAQQDAQRAAFIVEKALQEKQQKIVQAEGEAKAAEMLGEAVSKNPGYLKLRKIRASQTIAGVLATSQNRAYLTPAPSSLTSTRRPMTTGWAVLAKIQRLKKHSGHIACRGLNDRFK